MRAIIVAATVLFGTASLASAQEFEGVFTAKIKGVEGPIKFSSKGGKSRMDMSIPNMGDASILIDPATREMNILMPAQQMAMTMTMPATAGTGSGSAPTALTATGKRETVAGHECEYYQHTGEEGVTNICFTSGLGSLSGGSAMFSAPGPRGMGAVPAWAGAALSQGGFALKVLGANGEVIWEVLSVLRKSLEAALFVVPEGFQKMAMPFRRPPSF